MSAFIASFIAQAGSLEWCCDRVGPTDLFDKAQSAEDAIAAHSPAAL